MDGCHARKIDESARTNRTHHRSKHLLECGSMSGCRLVGRQLSLILRRESSFAFRDVARTCVTEECDKAEVGGRLSVVSECRDRAVEEATVFSFTVSPKGKR